MKKRPDIDTLRGLLEEIEHLEEAKSLLETLWFMERVSDHVSEDTWWKIDKFFGLDKGRDE